MSLPDMVLSLPVVGMLATVLKYDTAILTLNPTSVFIHPNVKARPHPMPRLPAIVAGVDLIRWWRLRCSRKYWLGRCVLIQLWWTGSGWQC
ncbi:hypothetical protein M408DRAFT_101628 [Serendipita vermifera MAFF 305830]|uniref:Uncharacterized protein n=1 Tax=Serendipita vermifera MAFF 305830 TaxID=933852 RepID=A0A0C2WWA6_SERVB|nr:hypothetical protein M408DRAFT_101628 [Serendipita vermifera MAFF 305830]